MQDFIHIDLVFAQCDIHFWDVDILFTTTMLNDLYHLNSIPISYTVHPVVWFTCTSTRFSFVIIIYYFYMQLQSSIVLFSYIL
jgi:hypothetical protein